MILYDLNESIHNKSLLYVSSEKLKYFNLIKLIKGVILKQNSLY